MEDDLQQASEDPQGSSVDNTDVIFSQFSSSVLNVLKVGHCPTNITALNWENRLSEGGPSLGHAAVSSDHRLSVNEHVLVWWNPLMLVAQVCVVFYKQHKQIESI